MPLDFPQLDRPHDLPWDRLVKVGNIHVKARTDRGLTLQEENIGYTSVEELINTAIADLPTRTTKMKVEVHSGADHMTIDDEMMMEDHTVLTGPAKIKLGANCDMLRLLDQTDAPIDFEICNLDFDGSRGVFAGHAINLLHTGASVGTERWKQVYNCTFDEIDGSGIKCDLGAGDSMMMLAIWNNLFRYTTEPNLYFDKVHDSYIYNNRYNAGGASGSVYENACTCLFHSKEYYAGNNLALNVIGGSRNHYIHNFMDFGSAGTTNAIVFSTSRSKLIDCEIRGQAALPVNPTAILLQNGGGAPAIDNEFDDIHVYSEVANKWGYAIEESDLNQDFNKYSNINGRDCPTGVLRILGVGSKIGGGLLGKVVTV